ncbi:endolytic transglycosylase MltG [Trujillonella endophytica]|uniref:Endolytic murein transglycosylase n=1 Tax=Trujillonella endophytica TaxID=673521 RepID=A0A1H8TYM2_9ACTN|nr:endolytic transglycosylase MltG [Trujillella endophytica]SEO95528.1 UPF0755 protein [Trujillella endophytica]
MSFPTPPGGRGGQPGPGDAGQSLSAWAAALPRQQPPARRDPGTPAAPVAVPPRRRAGVIDRADAPDFPIAEYARHSGGGGDDDESTGRLPGVGDAATPPLPPVPGAPLPPRPAGTWSRLQRRSDVAADDEATVAQPAVGTPGPPPGGDEHPPAATDDTGAHPVDGHDDHTGGLEVVVADAGNRRSRRARRAAEHDHDAHDHDPHDHDPHEDDDHADARPRRRRPVAILVSLVVLAAVVAGIVVGGKALLDLINPADEDYSGQGTGSVQVRIADGDTLSDIGRTLAEADVIASVGPFVTAAEAVPAAMGIQPGVYGMRLQMSGAAALDLLLDPASRLFSRVTIPEGFTVQRVLERLAQETDTPAEELFSASTDVAAIGLPPYANGLLEGWLFPATYDFEPETTPQQMLQQMVSRTVQVLDSLGVAPEQRLLLVTKASLVQAEASLPEDMGRVAQVLENRLASGMPLQLDSTVNYATGGTGITTTADERASDSPYNTYARPGLPPGAIGNPGEDALRAVLAPTPGPWLYFVTVNPDTGETRFAVTIEEHNQNVALFRQWLAENPD